MATASPRIYVESPSIIDLVRFKVGANADAERERDVWHLQRMLQAARDGKVQVFASALSIAECVHVKDPAKLDQAKPFFLGLLASGKGGFTLANPVLTLLEKARDLRWIQGIALGGADSIHAATALHFQCSELWTRDRKFTECAASFSAMGMRICAPSETAQLPDEYRQEQLGV